MLGLSRAVTNVNMTTAMEHKFSSMALQRLYTNTDHRKPFWVGNVAKSRQ